jgi:hypothetical protein
MEILELVGVPYFKKGKEIHIKKKNRGKFTEYCKGEVTQKCIDKAKKSKNPTLRKRATFAENARKWKHQQGGTMKRLNVKAMQKDPEYKNYDWYIDEKNIAALQDSLINRNAGYAQRLATLAMVIPENGGRTTPHGNGAYGLVGWRGDRAEDLPQDFGGQAHKLMVELFDNPNGKNWTDGGTGTGVQTGREMYKLFNTSPNSVQATKAMMKGYVRPPKSEYDKRVSFINLLKKYMQ